VRRVEVERRLRQRERGDERGSADFQRLVQMSSVADAILAGGQEVEHRAVMPDSTRL